MGHFKNLEITKESEFVPEQETKAQSDAQVEFIAKDLELSIENKNTLETKAAQLMNFTMARVTRYGILDDFARRIKAIKN